MPLRFELDFQTRSGGTLWLHTTRFHVVTAPGASGGWDSEMFATGDAGFRGDMTFDWGRTGCVALAVFFLRVRAHQLRHKSIAVEIRQSQCALVRSLSGAIRKRTEWVEQMFASRGKSTVEALFQLHHGHDPYVSLGKIWKEAQLAVRLDGRPMEQADEVDVLSRRIESAIAEEPFEAELDVVFSDESGRFTRSIRDGTQLPVLVRTSLRINVEFTQPAYAQMTWLNSAGKVQPLSPGEFFKWQPSTSFRPERAVSLPARQGQFSIEAAPGTETLVLFASTKPFLERHIKLIQKTLAPKLTRGVRLLEPTRPRWFSSAASCQNGQTRLTFSAMNLADPLAPLYHELRTKLAHEFDLIEALSFATAPIPSPQK